MAGFAFGDCRDAAARVTAINSAGETNGDCGAAGVFEESGGGRGGKSATRSALRSGLRANSIPGGDVPADTGVCTDEVIRTYRAVGVDLQKEVHEDMEQNFSSYPRRWRWLSGHPDTNIDHRRVPNLMVFFSRKGETVAIGQRSEDYAPGELVTWDLGGGVPHIGIVVDRKSPASGRNMILHNIGQGPKIEDVLFNWKITGHYRYFGPRA
jgi:uncharacterized protein YijF (DUF1287 family)